MEEDKTVSPKEKLEIEKLQVEIRDIKRRIRPQWIGASGPWFIGLLTIFLAYRSGFIDNKATLNEIKAAKVEAQVKEFEARRDSLHQINDSLSSLSKSLKFEASRLRTDSQRLIVTVNSLKKSKDFLQDQLNSMNIILKKKISDTSHFYEVQGALQKYGMGNEMDRLVTKIQTLNYSLGECEILRKRAQSELDNLKKQLNSAN